MMVKRGLEKLTYLFHRIISKNTKKYSEKNEGFQTLVMLNETLSQNFIYIQFEYVNEIRINEILCVNTINLIG